MSIILVLIAIEPDTVLCEHTNFNGNFLQVSRTILRKAIKEESISCINYDIISSMLLTKINLLIFV